MALHCIVISVLTSIATIGSVSLDDTETGHFQDLSDAPRDGAAQIVQRRAAELRERRAELLKELQKVEGRLASSRGQWYNSCANSGCTKFMHGASCQCTPQCKKYGNCCSDYDTTCGGTPASNSCASSDCTTFKPGASCQCTSACRMYGNCCPDYAEKCDDGAGDSVEEDSVEDAGAYNETRPCMCAFDIDRTLTAGQHEHCPSDTRNTPEYIYDDAYGGGRLKLGAVGNLGISNTVCKNCVTALISRGTAGGSHSQMRKYIMDNIIQTDAVKKLVAAGKIKLDWSDWYVHCNSKVDTPFLVRSPNECKRNGVEAARQLYASVGVNVAKRDVFFFDDHSSNIPYFKNMGFNAFEIGCDSHKNSHTSRCGATEKEIRLKHVAAGYEMCKQYH